MVKIFFKLIQMEKYKQTNSSDNPIFTTASRVQGAQQIEERQAHMIGGMEKSFVVY